MSYLVLARKWRPMRFDDLVGQDHVARTLANAIQSGRVAHAFLFTGVRGVGKTTSARILAKSLNCMGDPATAERGRDPGPTATPCLKCAACQEIATGTDVDVREIDGASYNGVDEVRKLQDSLPYRPARDRYKIFIVDEVHMLSQSAWNAFLKTLEEPPPHVKFIFATTEVHKVPVTILSRVQRFDFKLIPTQMIAERLRYVLGEERIQSDDAAISIIAREAAGSMRDAMSLLDQVIAYNAELLDEPSVSRVLGVASRQVLHDLALGILQGNPARCLELVSDLANQGYDIANVARDLLALLRDLVVAKVCPDPARLLDLADQEQKDVVALAGHTHADDLLRLHQGFSQAFDDVVRGPQPRAALEMLLVRLSRRPPLLPLDDLLGRLSSLERRLGGASSQGRAPAQTERVSSAPRDAGGRPREGGTPGAERRPSGRDRSDEPPPEALGQAPSAPLPRTPVPSRPPAPVPEPRPIPAPAPRAAEPPAAQDAAGQQPSGELERWRGILERLREQRPELAAFLEHAVPIQLGPDEVVLGWEPGSMFAAQVEDKASLALLASAAKDQLGGEPRVTFRHDYRAAAADTLAAVETRAREERVRRALTQAKEHPRVADAVEILGARLKDLKLAAD